MSDSKIIYFDDYQKAKQPLMAEQFPELIAIDQIPDIPMVWSCDPEQGDVPVKIEEGQKEIEITCPHCKTTQTEDATKVDYSKTLYASSCKNCNKLNRFYRA